MEIADAVQKILRATNHPELPQGEIQFLLHVAGAESWSWADIRNNGAVPVNSRPNPHNEMQDPATWPVPAVTTGMGSEEDVEQTTWPDDQKGGTG